MTQKLSFREHHLLELLTSYDQQSLPLDIFMNHYFRAHKAIGSKDRGFIADTVYTLVRWQGLLDAFAQPTWKDRFDCFKSIDLEQATKDPALPPHIRVSFPKHLYDLIVNTHGEEKALEICLDSNQPAPTTVRINTLKTTREAMLSPWKEKYLAMPCQYAPNGIVLKHKMNFFSLPEFLAGCFEVQDEGSQLISELMHVEPGQQVMDYCAGSAGKTLGFAPRMQGKGQIFVHDIRPHVLQEAKKRLRRAGIQNAQVVLADDPKLKRLKKRMDWVLVDAPCTGTGTMRRNPDMKWRFTEETLVRLVGQQRTIFEKALSFLKPGGRIVYATCSILKEENEEQVAHFQKTYGLEVEGELFQSIPKLGGMDGFFGAVLYKPQGA